MPKKIPVTISTNIRPKRQEENEISPIIDEVGQFAEMPAIEERPRKKFRLFRFVFKTAAFMLVFAVIGIVIFSVLAEKLPTENKPEEEQAGWFGKIGLMNQFKNLVESADRKVKGEENDRINILLLGMGGKNHSGGYLTDTIMLVSIQPSTGKVGMLSLPRDLTVPIEGVGWRKINNINAIAENKERGSGGTAVIQAVGDLLDLQIDYFVRVDFEGFIKIVDHLDGIEVNVENTLDDYKYPILGREDSYPLSSRYEHLHVDAGLQKMDGDLALKFARSRHAYGIEGSDFARAKRQQKIIEAVKEKALSMNMLLKPMAIKNILDDLNEHVSTNVEIWEMLRFYELSKNIRRDQIINKVLDNSAGGLLKNSVGEGGAYILIPKSGDFTEIQYLAASLLDQAPKKDKSEVIEEDVTIEVQNGTWINGLASKMSVDLEKYGFNVVRIGNCSRQNFQKTVIYDMTYGKKMNSLQILKQKTRANVAFGLPSWLLSDIEAMKKSESADWKEADFILIVGQDATMISPAAESSDTIKTR